LPKRIQRIAKSATPFGIAKVLPFLPPLMQGLGSQLIR